MKWEKHVKDSGTEQTYMVMQKHINGYGRMFGGMLMQWIDELAGIVARRHSEGRVTTACVDNLNFQRPVYLGDTVVLTGKVTYAGTTSMEIRVDTYVEKPDGMRCPINHVYVVMVAIDEKEQKRQVPGLILETEEEKAEWLGGKERYELRKHR